MKQVTGRKIALLSLSFPFLSDAVFAGLSSQLVVDVVWDSDAFDAFPMLGCSFTSANLRFTVVDGFPCGGCPLNDPDTVEIPDEEHCGHCSKVGHADSECSSGAGTITSQGFYAELVHFAHTTGPNLTGAESIVRMSFEESTGPACGVGHCFSSCGCQAYSLAWGYGVAEFQMDLVPIGRSNEDWQLIGAATVDDRSWLVAPAGKLTRVVNLVESSSGEPVGACAVLGAGPHREGRNMAPNAEGVWAGTLQFNGTGGGTVSCRSRSLVFQDGSMDVDGSGRFNGADVAALDLLEGSTDPNSLLRWDFNASNDIDAPDIALMAGLVDLSLDSGILGDYTGDDVLDCDDLDGIDALFVPNPPDEELSFDDSAATDTWTLIDYAVTVPAGASFARISLLANDEDENNGPVYMDAAVAERSSAAGVNQLLNASFEQGSSGPSGMPSWIEFAADGSQARKNAFEVPGYNGSSVLKISGFGVAGVFQHVLVAPGETLTVSVRAYSKSTDPFNSTEARAGIRIEFPGVDDNYAVELDENLDGALDANDRHWVYQAVHPGDIDADGDVDLTDLSLQTNAYGACEGDVDYSPYADTDRDGCVTITDRAILLAHYGESCP